MRKSKKSPKEKQKTTKPEPPPKKDPVQYVSETGDGLSLYYRYNLPTGAGQHDLKLMLRLIPTFMINENMSS